MAAGVDLPKRIVGHGWWLRDNEKISKSLGNVVRPSNIIDDFGADAFRYFLCREMTFGNDQNYSDEAFITRYNGDLANGIGNTLSRAVKMSDSYFGGKTPPTSCSDNDLMRTANLIVPEYLRAMDDLAFHRALEAVWRLVAATDAFIVSREPWTKFKQSGADETLSRILWNCLESLRLIWVMVAPFMPSSAREALARIGGDPTAIGADALAWGQLPQGVPLRAADPIFPRIDGAAYIGKGAAAGASPAGDSKTMDETKPAPQLSPATPPPIETTQAVPSDAAKITIDQFMAVELRVADVKAAERVPKSKKLMKLTVFTGDGERTIVAGIATRYTAEELVGRKIVIVANLEPKPLAGIESNGMVLAASIDGEPSLLSVDSGVPAGTRVR
jgi:methionyl-tRNA synthetase